MAVNAEYCLSEKSYKTLSKKDAAERMSECFEYLLETTQSDGQLNMLTASLVSVVEKTTGVFLPDRLKKTKLPMQFVADLHYLLQFSDEVEPVFIEYLYPFLTDPSNASLTLAVGPGDDYNQMYPHDSEFMDAVFHHYKKNVVLIFEGGGEEGFSSGFEKTFQNANEGWFREFQKDLQSHFGASNLRIQSPNTITKILEFTSSNGNDMMFVLFHHDFLDVVFEPLLKPLLTPVNTILCGIRSGICSEIFFENTDFFYKYFHTYIFTHGEYPSKRLKNSSSSFRINIERARNTYKTKNTLLNNIKRKANQKNAMGYGPSKLCNRSTRKPVEDPYCVQGKLNTNTFWKGVGGKTRKRQPYFAAAIRSARSRKNSAVSTGLKGSTGGSPSVRSYQ